MSTTETGLRCSDWARAEGIDPIGTIGTYAGFLLVEWPPPWPRDLADIEELARLRPALKATGCRLQGLVAAGDGAERVVIRYQRHNDGPFVRYQRREIVASPSTVVDAAYELLGADGDPSVDALDDDTITDVLVCTHGRRDRCCGSLGTDLARQLLADPDRLGPRTRVWRTSHTGGHRFAPTAVVLSEGTAWAFADIEALAQVTSRRGPLEGLLPRYRGCAGLRSRAVQALERAVLSEVGWDLFDRPRLGRDDGNGTATLAVDLPDGRAEWEARVEIGRRVPLPDCGAPIDTATKSEKELVLRDFRRIA